MRVLFDYIGFTFDNWLYKKGSKSPIIITDNISVFKPKLTINKDKILNKFFVISIIFSFIILCAITIPMLKTFTDYSNNLSVTSKKRENLHNKEAFNFLLNSGKNRLYSNNVLGAYSEFILAYKVYPNNKEINQLLIETLSILCDKEEKYCNELDALLNCDY